MAVPKQSNSAGDDRDPSDGPPLFDQTDWLPAPTVTGATGSGGSGGATGAVPATETITYAGSGLVFNNSYGSGVTTAFRNEIVAAENFYQSHYTNVCAINCSFDLQSLNPAYGGENSFNTITVSYATLVNALASHATSAADMAAVASLQKLADPSSGKGFELPLGEARILGLAGAGSGIDDAVVLNSYYWTSTTLQNDPNDAIATIEHEISEGGMGRIGALGIDGSSWAPMDLFRFTSTGQRDFTGGKDGIATYFSVDGSSVNTGLRFHNSVSGSGQFDGYDFADWDGVGADSNYNDPFGPGGPGAGGTGVLSATDLTIMDVLGWTPTPTIVAHPSADFTGTGTSDLVWRSSTGQIDAWLLSNGQKTGVTVLSSVSSNWQFAGSGDFNHDGTADMLWRNTSTGAVEDWLITNGQLTGGSGVGTVSSAWQALGTGDFNGDGTSDVLWKNVNTGEVDTWLLQNGKMSGGTGVTSVSSAWLFAGIGDFNNDGTSDVLWQNTNTGEVDDWLMGNGHITGGGVVGFQSSAWQPLGIGDFNGDGTSDVLWQNINTGEVDDWLISNGKMTSDFVLGTQSSAWQFAGVGSYFGNGTSDVMWRNTTTGEVDVWELANGQFVGSQSLGVQSTTWQVQPVKSA